MTSCLSVFFPFCFLFNCFLLVLKTWNVHKKKKRIRCLRRHCNCSLLFSCLHSIVADWFPPTSQVSHHALSEYFLCGIIPDNKSIPRASRQSLLYCLSLSSARLAVLSVGPLAVGHETLHSLCPYATESSWDTHKRNKHTVTDVWHRHYNHGTKPRMLWKNPCGGSYSECVWSNSIFFLLSCSCRLIFSSRLCSSSALSTRSDLFIYKQSQFTSEFKPPPTHHSLSWPLI